MLVLYNFRICTKYKWILFDMKSVGNMKYTVKILSWLKDEHKEQHAYQHFVHFYILNSNSPKIDFAFHHCDIDKINTSWALDVINWCNQFTPTFKFLALWQKLKPIRTLSHKTLAQKTMAFLLYNRIENTLKRSGSWSKHTHIRTLKHIRTYWWAYANLHTYINVHKCTNVDLNMSWSLYMLRGSYW